LDSLCVWHWKR